MFAQPEEEELPGVEVVFGQAHIAGLAFGESLGGESSAEDGGGGGEDGLVDVDGVGDVADVEADYPVVLKGSVESVAAVEESEGC